MIISALTKLKRWTTAAPRRQRQLAIAALTPLLLTACTSEALYNSIQQNQLQRCETIPIAQQAACKQQFQTSYEEYRRERDALVEEEQPR